MTSSSASPRYLRVYNSKLLCVCMCIYSLIILSAGGKIATNTSVSRRAVSLAGPAKGGVEPQVTAEERVLLWRSAVAGQVGQNIGVWGKKIFQQ